MESIIIFINHNFTNQKKYGDKTLLTSLNSLIKDLTIDEAINLLNSAPRLNEIITTLMQKPHILENNNLLNINIIIDAYKIINNIIDEEIQDDITEEGLDEAENIKNIEKNTDNIYYSEDIVATIISQTRKYPLLSKEETYELLKQYKNGSEYAKDKIILHNQRLVIKYVKQNLGRGLKFEDLFQEGCCGLAKAVEKFDINKGFAFSTYATWWIRQAVTRAIDDLARTIRIPVHYAEKLKKFIKNVNELEGNLGHYPTIEEIVEHLKIPKDEVIEYFEHFYDATSYNTKIGEKGEEDTELMELLPDSYNLEEKVIGIVSNNELKTALKNANLTDKELEVIFYRYGLNGEEPKTLEEIGLMFNVTRERIRQIEENALKKLRHPIRARIFKAFTDNPENSNKSSHSAQIQAPKIIETNLLKRIDTTKDILEQALNIIEAKYSKILIDCYDENFNIKPGLLAHTNTEINDAIKRLKLETNKIQGMNLSRNLSSLMESVKTTKEKLLEIIPKLSEEDQKIIYYIYDENLNRKDLFIDTKTNNKLTKIKNTIKKLILYPDKNPYTQKEYSFDYLQALNLSKIEFEFYLKGLNPNYQEFIKLYFDTDYKLKKNIHFTSNEQNIMHKIKYKIMDIIKEIEESEADKRQKDLIASLNTDKTTLINAISKLDDKDQALIKLLYDEDFMPKAYPKGTGNIYIKIAANIRNKIKNILNNADYQPRKTFIRNATLYTRIGITKEELESAINKLDIKHQEEIYSIYDSDFNVLPNIPKNTNFFAKEKTTIRRIMKAMNDEPIYLRKNLIQILNVDKEAITQVLNNDSALKNRVLKYYDENFEPRYDVKMNREDNSQLNSIKNIIKKRINGDEKKHMKSRELNEKFNITKEQLNTIITKLSDEDKNFIYKLYDEDFKPRKDYSRTNKDNYYFYYHITKHINNIINNPNYNPKQNSVKRRNSLTKRFNMPKEELKVYIDRLLPEERALIYKYYDEDFEPNDIPVPKEDRDKISANYLKRIKAMINNPNYKTYEEKAAAKAAEKQTDKNEYQTTTEHQKIDDDINKDYELFIKNSDNNSKIQKTAKNDKKINIDTPKFEMSTELFDIIGQQCDLVDFFEDLSQLESTIISLRLGYATGNCYSTKSIAAFLQIEEDIVRNVVRNHLETVKQVFNEVYDNFIDIVINDTYELTRIKKDEKN